LLQRETHGLDVPVHEEGATFRLIEKFEGLYGESQKLRTTVGLD